jgi:hypothetical protein
MVQTPPFDYDIDYKKLQDILDNTDSDPELFNAIVNAPMQDKLQIALLGLGIVVLLLVNKKAGTIDRIKMSDTEPAQGAAEISVKRFEHIKIPIDYNRNLIAKAISSGKPQKTTDWRFLFEPDLTAEEARLNQAGAGIGFSAIYPLIGARDGGALIFSYFQPPESIGEQHYDFMQEYSTLAANALSR